MGNIQLLHMLIICFSMTTLALTFQLRNPLTTSENPNQINTSKTVPPEATSKDTVTPNTTPAGTAVTQNQSVANLEATTISAAKDVQTSPSYRDDTSTILVKGQDLSSPMVENTEISRSYNSTQSPYNTGSVQTSTTQTDTPSAVVQTESATTRNIPTAKLSATTKFLPDVPKTTTKLAKTSNKNYPNVITIGRSTKSPKNLEEIDDGAKNSNKHGKIVAGVISSALLMLMVGLLVILYKKHKLKKQQVSMTEWAGPTPFLETGGEGTDNGHTDLRSSNRITLTSFLPQRLSKRFSQLAKSTEEMQDMQEMTTGTTFATNKEFNVTKVDEMMKKPLQEANENNSESSEKTQDFFLENEMNEKEGETSKDKTQ